MLFMLLLIPLFIIYFKDKRKFENDSVEDSNDDSIYDKIRLFTSTLIKD